MMPTVGQVVMYRVSPEDQHTMQGRVNMASFNSPKAEDCLPMMVTHVDAEYEIVNGSMFTDNGALVCILSVSEGDEPGQFFHMDSAPAAPDYGYQPELDNMPPVEPD